MRNKIVWATYRGMAHEKVTVEGMRRSCETKHELYASEDCNKENMKRNKVFHVSNVKVPIS